jgi:hypothetical protein
MSRANDYLLFQRPYKWVSAHREFTWIYSLPTRPFFYFETDGLIEVLLTSSFSADLEVGSRIYFRNFGALTGFHVVKSITSQSNFTLQTAYPSTVISSVGAGCEFVDLPSVTVYSGWQVGELIIGGVDMSTVQPYKLIATFRPEADLNGRLRFNLSGYAQAAFPTPYKILYNIDEVNYNIFTGTITVGGKEYIYLRHFFNGSLKGENYVANSGLTVEDLNRYYVKANSISECGFTKLLIDGQRQETRVINENQISWQ